MMSMFSISVVLLPLFILKMVSSFDLEVSLVLTVVSSPLSMSLLLMSMYFTLIAMKPLLKSNTPGLMMFLIVLHILAFMSTELLLVLLLSDLMLVWIILSFSFNHSSKYEVVSNTYLMYYIIIPSAPLLIFVFYDWFISSSSLLCKNYLMLTSLESENTYFKWILMLSSLAKLPVFSFHYWLPKAHVQAPTILSMILAGLSLKVGLVVTAYLVTVLNLLSNESYLVYFILLLGMLMSTFISSNASDSKVFLAYCSVSHMTLVCLSVMMMTSLSFKSGLLISLSHCLSSPMLFYLAGNMQYSLHSRSMYSSHSVKSTAIMITLLLLLLLDLPFPPAFSFWSEVSILSSLYSNFSLCALILILPMVILLRGYEYMYSSLKSYSCSTISSMSLILSMVLISSCFLM